jgi:SHS2 domain-containing protein
MQGGFTELENITADIGIEAWGSTLEDAFASAANGLARLMSDLPADLQTLTRNIQVQAGSLSSLLVQFLNEIVFLEETEGFLPAEVTNLTLRSGSLNATLSGFIFDPGIHSMNAHIKAATYHGLEIDQSGERVTIKVIFDV